MQSLMNTHEVFSLENRQHLEGMGDDRKFRENMVQMGWFEHHFDSLTETEVEAWLRKILSTASTEQQKRIEAASSAEEKKQILLEEMILSPSGEGSVERTWFRESFLMLPEAGGLLHRFPDDPDKVLKDIEALFRRSRH